MRTHVFSLILILFSMGALAQHNSSIVKTKRLSMNETPDSLTPGAYHYAGYNFSRYFSSFCAFTFEKTFERRRGFQLEMAYKPNTPSPSLPSRYAWFPANTSRKASFIWSGKLSYRYYLRAGKQSFFYIGPYFRFDYLGAKNVLIYDCYGSEYPAYIFSRSTRLFIGGISAGSRSANKRNPFYFGISIGGGFYDDHNQIIQLKPLDYEDPHLDYNYGDNGFVPDVTFDLGFTIKFRKRAMFGR